ncbi:cyclic nucleotide-binding domain-containing protein 2-like [Eleutherodactylus coqui]|uniref:cyclic nucleotide-binding domain-containing protein 2-like n=1 Tax=Eleutherodactylus coqui TaxID=57060 RepID=UPI0034625F13
MSPAETQDLYPGSSRQGKTLQHAVHQVILLQAAIRCFTQTAEEARGSSFWGNVGMSGFPSQEQSYANRVKNTKKKKEELSFDVTLFKSQYEFIFPGKAIAIALQRPEDRAACDIRFIRSMMMGILSFRRYSTHMQHMLARVAYYRRFGRGRVVVRKGHWGDGFYFVFSGVIAVTQDEDGSSALLDPEPILLQKGASFGEVALLKGMRRNATVICMEDTEFLVVDRTEFFQNKLDQELQKELQYRFQFFRSLDLFSTWSDQTLQTLADHCKMEESHHSQVMVNDTHETKNIIFVTKGRCEILRLVDLSQCPSLHKWIKQHQPLLGTSTLLNYTGRTYGEQQAHGILFPGGSEPSDTRPFSLEDPASQCDLPLSSAEYPGNLELPGDLTAAVYMRIDSLQPGQYFRGVDIDYISCCLEKEGRQLHDQSLFQSPPVCRDVRSMVIISQGAEVIRIKLDKFAELLDFTTLKKLKEKMVLYPSDDDLCRIFLEQNRWNIFKSDLVSRLRASPKPHQKHDPRREKFKAAENCQSADRRGILQPGDKTKPEKVWTTTLKQKISDCGKHNGVTPHAEAPIRLIHGIDVPKLYGRRMLW